MRQTAIAALCALFIFSGAAQQASAYGDGGRLFFAPPYAFSPEKKALSSSSQAASLSYSSVSPGCALNDIRVKLADQRCSECAAKLMRAMAATPGFEQASFDPYRKRIILRMTGGGDLSAADARAIMLDAGYLPDTVTRGCAGGM